MRKITEDQIKQFIDLWNSGVSCIKIAKQLGVSSQTVSRYLKESGITVVNKQNEIKFDVDQAIKDYLDGISLVRVCEKYHTTYTYMKKVLNSKGIDIINKQNETKFNENIFDSIDNEEKAYWLGFIFADGYIATIKNPTKPHYNFEISLQLDDEEHLQKFNKFMEHKDPNHVKCDSYRCRWIVANKHLWETLNSYGCTPRKSLTLEFPDESIFKDKSLIRHFIRGYFDGDGSIGIYNNLQNPHVSLLGTKEFLVKIQSYLFSEDLTLSSKNSTESNTFSLQSARTRAVTWAYILYYKSNIYLERKYQKFLQFTNCRFKAKALELLEGKIGEGWDANPELIADLNDLQQCNA